MNAALIKAARMMKWCEKALPLAALLQLIIDC